MSFPIIQEYEVKFPECKDILQSLNNLYNKKYPIDHLGCGTNSLLPVSNSCSITLPKAKSLLLSTTISSNDSKKILIRSIF